ncbi:MAG: hypothetical protein ACXQTL_07560 [Methanosarcinales archaeon]
MEYLSVGPFGLYRIRITDEVIEEVNRVQKLLRELPDEYYIYAERDYTDFDTNTTYEWAASALTLRIRRNGFVIGVYWEEGFEELEDMEDYIGWTLETGRIRPDDSAFLTEEEKKRCIAKYKKLVEEEHGKEIGNTEAESQEEEAK